MYSLLLILILSIVFPGIIVRIKSITAGRKGPAILQPMSDLIKLFRKDSVYSTSTSWVFKMAPIVSFASLIIAVLIIPFGSERGVISFQGDFIFFIYLLATGKFLMIIAALDTGSSFEGMGASREALYSMLAEPAFFVLFASYCMLTGSTSFYDMLHSLHFQSTLAIFLAFLSTYNLFQISMLENSRLPYDDPKTHLELTMVHEVMVLDYSGFDLALIQLTGHIRFVMYSMLVANLFIMPVFPMWLSVLIFAGITVFYAIAVGLAESFRARYKLRNNNKAIVILIPISILIFFGCLLIINNLY